MAFVHCIRLFVYAIVIISSVYQAAALSDGAPERACQTMIPEHATNKPQTRPPPFTITVDKTGYVPGDSVRGKSVLNHDSS
jgi:hypothetical protein